MATYTRTVALYVAAPILLYGFLVGINRIDFEAARAFVSENGLIELIQFGVAGLACLLALATFRRLHRDSDHGQRLRAWLLVLALGSFYIAAEEISWGQWFFAWETPEPLKRVNVQGETNLHNISSWLNEKPRTLFEIAVIIGGIVIPLIRWIRPSTLSGPGARLFLPSLFLLPTAVLAEWSRLSERAATLFQDGAALSFFHLVRPSEVQELFFYVFLVLYVLELRARVLPDKNVGAPKLG